MKRRWLSVILAVCTAISAIQIPIFAAENSTDSATAGVTYTLSGENNQILTVSGTGEITSLELNKTLSFDEKERVTSIIIDSGITGIADDYNTLLTKVKKITLKGSGNFRFGNYAFRNLDSLSVESERDSIEVGSYTFQNTQLLQFPLDSIVKIKSFGFSNAQLPVEGKNLTLHFADNVDMSAKYPSNSIYQYALSGVKNSTGETFSSADITISGTVAFGEIASNRSNIFGSSNSVTALRFHLEDGARLVFGGGLGLSNLETLTFDGTGAVDFQHPDYAYAQGNALEGAVKLSTIDFTGFTGDILFSKKMFNTKTGSQPQLREVLLGDGCSVTRIKESAFAYCSGLTVFDFSKVTGEIEKEAFRDTGLTEANLSNVTSIGYCAFENVTGVSDWSSICSASEKGTLKKLEFSNVFLKTDSVWELVQKEMDGKFSLNQDGSYPILKPSDNRWEDSKSGNKNQTGPDSTQLIKSAKWTNEDKTTAQVEIQAAYTPNKQMDFIFILDTSTSMQLVNNDETAMNKMYEMLSKTADVTDSLLTSKDVDSRVAMLSFGSGINDFSGGFFTEENAGHASEMIRNLHCKGSTDYTAGLQAALSYVSMAQSLNRKVSVIFLSDGEANQNVESIASASDALQDLGVQIIGVLYKIDPRESEREFIDMACTEYYEAADTESFSQAVNRTIYDAFHTFTLTDRIGEDFLRVADNDLFADSGTVMLKDDGRTIIWDLTDTEPYRTYTLNISMRLAADSAGNLPNGNFPTNDGDALLQKNESGIKINQVASPQLRRGGGSSTVYHTLRYVSNGGTPYDDEKYKSGALVQIDKIPSREGYIFTGWFSDETLIRKISEIQMTSDKTIYAGWKKTDVPNQLEGKNHFAYIIGYPDGNIHPMGKISRAETATIFFRLLKNDVRDNNLTEQNNFSDVKMEQWFCRPVSTMTKLGIIRGRSADRFEPNDFITRAEFAVICSRFDTGLDQGENNFPDIQGHWAEAEIRRAASLGWILGQPDGTFDPDDPITRAEAMTMINRVLNRLPKGTSALLDDMNQWPDNLDAKKWYYMAIQEATNSHEYESSDTKGEKWTKITDDPNWKRYEQR